MGAETLVIAQVVSAAAGAFSTIQSGRASAAAAEFEAQQLQEQKEMAQIQALQQEAEERRKLRAALSAQNAAAASQGRVVGYGDQSLQAIQRSERETSRRNIKNIRMFGDSRIRRYELGIGQKKIEAKSARQTSLLGAAGTIADTTYNIYNSGYFNQKGK